MAIPVGSRLTASFKDHIDLEQALYAPRDGMVDVVHVEPITHDLPRMVGYIFKAFLRGRVGVEDIIVLPRSRSELS